LSKLGDKQSLSDIVFSFRSPLILAQATELLQSSSSDVTYQLGRAAIVDFTTIAWPY
jgi:hypothetical protein